MLGSRSCAPDLGWLTAIKTNDSDVEYHVTDMGRAVAVAKQF
jgi:hypothetical protein